MIKDNSARMLDHAQWAEKSAEVAIFTELAQTGYPPRDLMKKPSFVARAEEALATLAADTRRPRR